MRKKAERQLPLDFTGAQKLTKEWHGRYRNIHEILEGHAQEMVRQIDHCGGTGDSLGAGRCGADRRRKDGGGGGAQPAAVAGAGGCASESSACGDVCAKAGRIFKVGWGPACWLTTWFCWRERDAPVATGWAKNKEAAEMLCAGAGLWSKFVSRMVKKELRQQ